LILVPLSVTITDKEALLDLTKSVVGDSFQSKVSRLENYYVNNKLFFSRTCLTNFDIYV